MGREGVLIMPIDPTASSETTNGRVEAMAIYNLPILGEGRGGGDPGHISRSSFGQGKGC